MKSLINLRMKYFFALPLLLLLMAVSMVSQGQTVVSPTLNIDKLDYAPGETVRITGTGWKPGEVVTLQVDHLSDPIPDHGTPDPHLPWDITVEADGSFAATW